MRHKKLTCLLLCVPLVFAACGGGTTNAPGVAASSSAPSPQTNAPALTTPTPDAPQTQKVTATVEETKLNAGGAGVANLTLDIAEGYHIHANPASDKFYVATEVRAEPQEGVTPGKPVYPSALTKKFEFSNTPLAVYEGHAVIRLPLRADKNAVKGRHSFRAKIRLQPCNDQVCLPPREIDASIPLTIN
ncbi:MAG: hypothetical protein QOC99_2247 [Acidobacteriota bacterium]|jgi:hypothetical protein|nr:hypothetical protein [Acidobacteriota bacterium]